MGGGSILVDGFRVAEEFRNFDPDGLGFLSTIDVEFRFHDEQVDSRRIAGTPATESDNFCNQCVIGGDRCLERCADECGRFMRGVANQQRNVVRFRGGMWRPGLVRNGNTVEHRRKPVDCIMSRRDNTCSADLSIEVVIAAPAARAANFWDKNDHSCVAADDLCQHCSIVQAALHRLGSGR